MPETVYVVLFRGVGGDARLPSAPLREALREAGFGNVTTYIATGNAVVTSPLDAEHVRACVAALAERKFGFAKRVFVLAAPEWARLVRQNPFPEAAKAPRTLHAFVLDAKPPKAIVAALAAKAAGRERLAAKGRCLYFHAPDGFGRSKLPAAIETAFARATTARNWRTVAKLAELAQQAANSASDADL
jgi:uncharacterized protein (DUF1697 family)